MPRQKETPAIPTVHEALDVLTIEQLKPLVALLPTAERPTRKGELVALIEQYLSGTGARYKDTPVIPAMREALDLLTIEK